MKICDTYEALLDLYLDAELSPGEMVRIQTHLNECPACRAYVDDMLEIRAALPSVEETVVPEHFSEAVMAAVSAQTGFRRTKHSPWSKILLPLAACCAMVILLQNGPGFRFGSKAESPAIYTKATSMKSTADAAAPEEAVVEEGAPEEAVEETFQLLEDAAASEPAVAAVPECETEPAYEYTANSSQSKNAKLSSYRLRICVDAEYIGDLLNAYTPLSVQEQEDWYELPFAQYQMLLESLSTRSELPAEETFNDASDTVLIIVRH